MRLAWPWNWKSKAEELKRSEFRGVLHGVSGLPEREAEMGDVYKGLDRDQPPYSGASMGSGASRDWTGVGTPDKGASPPNPNGDGIEITIDNKFDRTAKKGNLWVRLYQSDHYDESEIVISTSDGDEMVMDVSDLPLLKRLIEEFEKFGR